MKWVGKNVSKIDGVAIATGKPLYTEDLTVPGTLVVKLLRSPHAFARITAIDTDAAKALAGVECVLTHQDVPQVRYSNAGQSFPEPSPYDRLILDPIVRYVGDEVAIVAAVDEKTALAALDLIKVEYEVFAPVLDLSTAIDHPSVVHPETDLHCNFPIGLEQQRNIAASHTVEVGDLEAELSLCDVVVEESYKTQAQAQAMMETFRSFTYMDQAGRLVVISSTQIPFHVRRQLARALQIPATRIRVIKPRIGGGFGAKQTGVCEVYPAIVTLKTGKPAKVVYERKETFIASNSRHATEFKVRMGASRDGIIRAIDIVGLSDTGAYGEHAPTVFAVIGDKTMPLYNKTTAIRYQGHAVYTNKLPGGALRGYGATQGTFVQESTVNKLAAELGIDPTEIRLKNLIREAETSLYYKGKKLGSSSLHRCIETGKSLIGWDAKFPRIDEGNKVRGVGMAVTMQGSGIANIDTASAEIRLNDDGFYTVLVGSTDMGTGSDTILLQMAADVLDADIPALMGVEPWHAVGNLPYYATTPIVLRLLSLLPESMTLMVQKEAAPRFFAPPKDRVYGPVAVVTGCLYEAKVVVNAPRSCFNPPPEVDSVVVRLSRNTQPGLDGTAFLPFLKQAFSMRRKTLYNNLNKDERSTKTPARLNYPANPRAEAFPPEALRTIFQALQHTINNELN